MSYEKELNFYINILKNLNINTYLISDESKVTRNIDYGLRQLLMPDRNSSISLLDFGIYFHPNTIYLLTDEFDIQYIILVLPEKEKDTYLLTGPFTWNETSPDYVMKVAERHQVPSDLLPNFKFIYQQTPTISKSVIMGLVNTLASVLWHSLNNFQLEEIHSNNSFYTVPTISSLNNKNTEELALNMEAIEKIYHAENELIKIVSQGHLHKVESALSTLNLDKLELRFNNSIKTYRYYAIVLNTLMRKSAETGKVHPILIDQISSQFANKIEMINSKRDGALLFKEIIRKYTLLVKNHSLQGYSPTIQKVLTYMAQNISDDMSLKTLAGHCNINPSYLSSLFKKEMGIPLSEFIIQQRVKYAIFLLNSTNLQIQAIAQQCGFVDVCYFSRMFKQVVGKPPSQYRSMIQKK